MVICTANINYLVRGTQYGNTTINNVVARYCFELSRARQFCIVCGVRTVIKTLASLRSYKIEDGSETRTQYL